MIDPATDQFEIVEINTKSAENMINTVDQAWLSRYSWLTKVISDRGREFMKEFKQTLEDNYAITKRTIATKNPQSKTIFERVHQTIGNMVRTLSFKDFE